MTATACETNPAGRSFLSYRRTASGEAARLIEALRVRGIPTWRDVNDLQCEPTAEALIRELESPETASVLWVLTPDVADSAAILRLEAPRIFRRVRAKDGFFAEVILGGGLEWEDVADVLRECRALENLSRGWNLTRVSWPLTESEVRDAARKVLRRRIELIASDSQDPIELVLHTRSDAPMPSLRKVALQLDWSGHFIGRCASPASWSGSMLPGASDVVAAIQRVCPERPVIASGACCIPAAFVLGRVFAEPSRLHLVWRQHTQGADQDWSLREAPQPCGFVSRTQLIDFHAQDAAVLINVRANVEPAVHASMASLPPFSVVMRVGPQNEAYPASLSSATQATDLARLVASELRRLHTDYPHIERTHIFLSGPVGLAVLIGQQLNGLGPVQTYEHIQSDAQGRYVPSALLTDQLSGEA